MNVFFHSDQHPITVVASSTAHGCQIATQALEASSHTAYGYGSRPVMWGSTARVRDSGFYISWGSRAMMQDETRRVRTASELVIQT